MLACSRDNRCSTFIRRAAGLGLSCVDRGLHLQCGLCGPTRSRFNVMTSALLGQRLRRPASRMAVSKAHDVRNGVGFHFLLDRVALSMVVTRSVARHLVESRRYAQKARRYGRRRGLPGDRVGDGCLHRHDTASGAASTHVNGDSFNHSPRIACSGDWAPIINGSDSSRNRSAAWPLGKTAKEHEFRPQRRIHLQIRHAPASAQRQLKQVECCSVSVVVAVKTN